MELRQLRYFVTLAEELHFGHAATREHIVQSALSQQLQRLERELGVRLLERTTHHVRLTQAGAAFLVEARQILAQVDRAATVRGTRLAQRPACGSESSTPATTRCRRSFARPNDSTPELDIHQVEASVPAQFTLLALGRLDVGLGRASMAPSDVASELLRLDPLGVVAPDDHPFAALPEVPVGQLAAEPLLLAEEERAPEFNQFVIELCRSVGFTPTVYHGTVESIRAGLDLVAQGLCVVCVPSSCTSSQLPGTVWRPLVQPPSRYPWSVLWRSSDPSEHVQAVVECARSLSLELGWLETTDKPTG